MSDEIASVAEIFGIGRNRLIAESISNFVGGEISRCEKRIGKLWIENDMLNKKYGMSLTGLCKVLDEMESEEKYEEAEIKGFSIMEAVSDTRRWEHVIEDLERDEARYMKLMESKKRMESENR
ncbi:MAG: hypothetical protein LAKADJCE_00466 [Candidatus Argoarchaeum ethanivorans]|uniref:Uncharacterized protein n=1 Tax=Candidatus Argoarchaeum ethanivorans TaxID=2608793 RepID=A0A811TBT9_9EURY|nr:MAG: hypothetical protein LAKADJCE_00466 [Candidatus Argoarchaeum ethanivorans]